MNYVFAGFIHELMVDVKCTLKEFSFIAEKTLYENKL